MDFYNDFFAPIGILVVIGFILYIFLSREDQLDRGEKVGNGLLDKYPSLNDDFREFKKLHPNWSQKKLIEKFFTDERMQKVLEWENESEKINQEYENKKKKKYTLFRVFAYKYEDFIFSLFAPHAHKSNSFEDELGYKWKYFGDSGFSKDYIISQMKKEKLFQDSDAEELFNKFVENELISVYPFSIYKKGDYPQKTDESQWTYNLGNTLNNYANIISPDDMNIDKWIKKHYDGEMN